MGTISTCGSLKRDLIERVDFPKGPPKPSSQFKVSDFGLVSASVLHGALIVRGGFWGVYFLLEQGFGVYFLYTYNNDPRNIVWIVLQAPWNSACQFLFLGIASLSSEAGA